MEAHCVQGTGRRLVWVEPCKKGRKEKENTGQRDGKGLL